ncbi:hypothetical protein FC99_GL000751 [Levilactobacillus koreensis JCM 16448]|nr:hypothetical protein FC99_GL000751 [Levilactobacillus koreensis JCM 16448]
MKLTLFYAAGASPMAPHILLEELGLPYHLEKVNLDNKTWGQGDYNHLNPKSYVPALKVDDQPLLTECAVILEFEPSRLSCRNTRHRPTGSSEFGSTTLQPSCTKTSFHPSDMETGCQTRPTPKRWCGYGYSPDWPSWNNN